MSQDIHEDSIVEMDKFVGCSIPKGIHQEKVKKGVVLQGLVVVSHGLKGG